MMKKENVFEHMESYEHEEVLFLSEKETRLRAIIAIHDTTLGPALGGVRIFPYKDEGTALFEALRLSKAMTYMGAISGADFGGAKAILWADSHDKNEAYFRAFGRFIHGLGGRFIAYAGLGTDEFDMGQIARETEYVLVTRDENGKVLDSARLAAYGLYWGMKACNNCVWGVDSLKGRVAAIQGVGEVGSQLVEYLIEEGCHLIITDIDYDAIKRIQDKFPEVEAVKPGEIYGVKCDFFSPCAISGVLTEKRIERLKCKIVAGSADCVLRDDSLADDLAKREILFAPDFAIGGGELVVSAVQSVAMSKSSRFESARRVYDIMAAVFERAKKQRTTPLKAAISISEERIEKIAKIKRIQRH
jgi:leucine dehydrogenase